MLHCSVANSLPIVGLGEQQSRLRCAGFMSSQPPPPSPIQPKVTSYPPSSSSSTNSTSASNSARREGHSLSLPPPSFIGNASSSTFSRRLAPIDIPIRPGPDDQSGQRSAAGSATLPPSFGPDRQSGSVNPRISAQAASQGSYGAIRGTEPSGYVSPANPDPRYGSHPGAESTTASSSATHGTPQASVIPQIIQSNRYELRVRQQPSAARACGFGERDRRVIDPPPIVQLLLKDPPGVEKDTNELRYPFNIVHCTLWDETATIEETALTSNDARVTRRLMGTLVSSPFFGLDEYGEEGSFFCFPDLSCRTHGRYRLRFVMTRLDMNNMGVDSFSPVLTSILSDVFTVYTAKDFPGMRASTPLTIALKRQGCAISVKKGNERSTNPGTMVGGGAGGGVNCGAADDDSDFDDTDPSGGGGKRRRR